MRQIRRFTVVLSALLVVAAGCGSGGDLPAATSSTRTTPTAQSSAPPATTPVRTASAPTSSRGVPTAATAKATLARTTVRAADLPTGWTEAAPAPGDQKLLDQFNARFLSCVGVRNTDLDRVATRTTTFKDPRQSGISSDATVYPSREDLANDAAIWRNPRTPGCYRKIVTQGSTPQNPVTADVTITGRRPGQPAQVVANRVARFTYTNYGKRVTGYSYAVNLQGPLLEVEIDFENPTTPIAASLRAAVVAAVAARVASTTHRVR